MTPRPRRQPRPSTVPGWVKFVGFVVLLAAVVGGIVYAAQPPDQRESAKGTAELIAEAMTRADLDAYRSYVCDADELTISVPLYLLGRTTVLAVSDEDDDAATATLTSDQRPEADSVLLLSKREDSWCVVVMTSCLLAADSLPRSSLPDVRGCSTRPGRLR